MVIILKKIKKRCLGLALLTITLAPIPMQMLSNPTIVNAVYTYGGDEEDDCTLKDSSKKNVSSSNVSDADAGGEWTTEGSKSYEIAKALFDTLTKDFGLSGTAAAGWIGNVQAESSFNPEITEGENGQNYSGRGYGLFQFTPGTKYLNSSYYKKGASIQEEVKNQVSFVMDSEFKNGEYKSYLPNATSWFGLSGIDNIDDVFDQSDPETSALVFFAVYERGDVAQMHRERRLDAAKKANEIFNKDKVAADKSKWVTNGSGTSDNTNNISTKGDKSKSKSKCDTSKSISGGAWGKDGTGTYSANNGSWQAWTPDDLPEELKKYALNPESVGMKFGESFQNTGSTPHNGWFNYCDGAPGQCTEFANSIFYGVWKKNGQGEFYPSPNGNQVTATLKSIYGGEITSTPKSGAIFSYGPTGNHVGIVSHVFENGDYLIIEQNVAGKSGFQISKPNTWSYEYVPKSNGEATGYNFWYPGDNGFTVNPDAKTLA